MKRCERVHEEHGYQLACDERASIIFVDDRSMREVALCAKHAAERQVQRHAERAGLRTVAL